jgi:D-glycero-alpha-D-manno-heptose-7-phosphate kinase
MILVRAPLRISFFGGGSDLPAFYNKETGHVLSTTIDKSIYLGINRSNNDHVKVVYSEIEIEKDASKIKHNIVRETLKHFGINDNIEISTFADIPVKGTGLGSSSSYCTALIKACAHINGSKISAKEVAEMACKIEIEKCNEPIGKQDQYAAALGGFNLFTFTKEGVDVKRVEVSDEMHGLIEESVLLFYTGIVRNARDVLAEQTSNLSNDTGKIEATKKMAQIAIDAYELLPTNNIDVFGHLLDNAWKIKRTLAGSISSPLIDQMYSVAMENMAWGCKVLGAGGGGYLMVMANPKYHNDIKKALKQFPCFTIKMFNKGTEIVYSN